MKKLVQNLLIGQSFDTISDVENNNNNSSVEHHSTSRTDSVISSTNDNILPDSGRMSPTPVKKRTLSRIFSVFTSRSGSLSLPSNASNNDLSPMTPPSSEGNTTPNRTITLSNKESMKRAASVVSLFFQKDLIIKKQCFRNIMQHLHHHVHPFRINMVIHQLNNRLHHIQMY
jgi:hypothetical protein